MNSEMQSELIKTMMNGELLSIDFAGVLAMKSKNGDLQLNICMIGANGKRYVVTINRELALVFGEKLVRAVDAFDEGLVPSF